MSKKIVLAIVGAVLLILGVFAFLFFDSIAKYEGGAEKRQKQIWINEDQNRCHELFESGFFNGWMDNQPQNMGQQRGQLQTCLDRAVSDADVSWNKMKAYKIESQKEYEKNVWKIKVEHYNDLILFKKGSFDCDWIVDKIGELKDTRKTNWSPLDQRQWNDMINDYVKERNLTCP